MLQTICLPSNCDYDVSLTSQTFPFLLMLKNSLKNEIFSSSFSVRKYRALWSTIKVFFQKMALGKSCPYTKYFDCRWVCSISSESIYIYEKKSAIFLQFHRNLRFPSFFSSPGPKGHVSFCHHFSSVVRPSVVRPSVNFFKNLLLWNYWANLNQTWSESLPGYLVSKLYPRSPRTETTWPLLL